MYYCIYQITNKLNGHRYIGQHQYTNEANPMEKYIGSGKILHLSYKKYGIENFETEILYKRIVNKETADAMEIWAIEKYKPEYNIAKGGTGGNIISQLSKEAYNKYIQKLSEHSYFRGKRFVAKEYMNEEEYTNYKNKISESNKKVVHTKDWNEKVKSSFREFMNENGHTANYGKKFTDEHSNKISNSRKGYKWFNNGKKSVQAKECPNGFASGLCETDKAKRIGHTPWNKGRPGTKTKGSTGMHWYTNGVENKLRYECPTGYVLGRITKKEL